jgi:hypothetical protein
LTSGCQLTPSFCSTECTSFSTERAVMTSDVAIAALL